MHLLHLDVSNTHSGKVRNRIKVCRTKSWNKYGLKGLVAPFLR